MLVSVLLPRLNLAEKLHAVYLFLTLFLGFFLFANFSPAVNFSVTTTVAAAVVVLLQA